MDALDKYRILLVDDNKCYLKALKLQLNDTLKNRIGCIDEVNNGEEAIKYVHKKKCNIIFMDINLPGVNGIDTTKYISCNFPDIRIIAISMHNEVQYVEKMTAAGSFSFIPKDKLDDAALLKVFDSLENF